MIESLDLIELMICVEDAYGVVLDVEDFEGTVDVRGLIDILCVKLEPVHG
jgi:acyl carrier protein